VSVLWKVIFYIPFFLIPNPLLHVRWQPLLLLFLILQKEILLEIGRWPKIFFLLLLSYSNEEWSQLIQRTADTLSIESSSLIKPITRNSHFIQWIKGRNSMSQIIKQNPLRCSNGSSSSSNSSSLQWAVAIRFETDKEGNWQNATDTAVNRIIDKHILWINKWKW